MARVIQFPRTTRNPRRRSAVYGMKTSDNSTVIRMAQTPLFAPRSDLKMLSYYSNSSLAVPVTGLGVSYVYSANGLYDPDISGTGTQPTGFDQMMVFYEHYTVYRATCRVTFRNYSTNIAPVVYLAARGDVTNISAVDTVMTTGNTVATSLLPAGVYGSQKELTLTVDIARFLGFDDLQDSNVARGDIAANPSEGAFFHVGAFNNESAAAGTVVFQVRIEYSAVFSEPRVITPSLRSTFLTLIRNASEQKS